MTITSYGVISYNIDLDGTVRYLFVQRRYSFSYNALLRGHYKISDISYLKSLAKRLTPNERIKLSQLDFNYMWKKLWLFSSNNPMYSSTMSKARSKFNHLRDSGLLSRILDSVPVEWDEPEWGFPKGKRFNGESGEEAAHREFLEETNLPEEHITFIGEEELYPLCEEYTGDNGIRYKHLYYIAKSNSTIGYTDPTNLTQACEIGKVVWVTSEQAQSLFRPYHTARKDAFNTLSDWLSSSSSSSSSSSGSGVSKQNHMSKILHY